MSRVLGIVELQLLDCVAHDGSWTPGAVVLATYGARRRRRAAPHLLVDLVEGNFLERNEEGDVRLAERGLKQIATARASQPD